MIGNITTGKNFSNLASYLLGKDKNAQIIGGNLMGTKPVEIAKEFRAWSECRPDVTKPVKHYSLSFAPADGELSNKLKEAIAEDFVRQMGYEATCPYDNETKIIDNQFLVVAHGRKDPGHEKEHHHDHIHIVVNLINSDGIRVKDGWDRPRMQKILRSLEKKYNLTQIKSSHEVRKKFSSLELLNYDQNLTAEQKSNTSILDTILYIVEDELKQKPDYETLKRNLDRRGIRLEKLTGRNKGYKFTAKKRGEEFIVHTNKEITAEKLTDPRSKGDLFYSVNRQREALLLKAKQKINRIVEDCTKDNPDYFLFAQRLLHHKIKAKLYRTKGRKRQGRYKLKYQISREIQFQSHTSVGGTLSQLISSGKINFDPDIHYQKSPPQEIVDKAKLEIKEYLAKQNLKEQVPKVLPVKKKEAPPEIKEEKPVTKMKKKTKSKETELEL